VSVRLIGEGGVEWEFDLPLSETYADQVVKRALRPADDESAAALAELLAPADGSESGEAPSEPSLGARIDAVSSHAEANELGAELGLAFDAKKPALDEKKAAMHEAAAAAVADGSESA